MKSRLLLDEPEFDSVIFDPDLLRQHILELLESQLFSLEDDSLGEEEDRPSRSDPCENEADFDKLRRVDFDRLNPAEFIETNPADFVELIEADESEHQAIGEKFRYDVLPLLITPDFIRTMTHALRACETRLKRTGYREKAEVAFVARSFFELADPGTLIFHPLILKICARTLEQVLEQPQFMIEQRDAVQSALSNILGFSKTQEIVDEQDSMDEEGAVDSESTQEELAEPEEELADEVESMSDAPPVSTEDLPAKALYKNFSWLETRHAIEVGNGYQVFRDTNQQVEFVHIACQRYITLTADRVLLQCPSKDQLKVAMKEVEELCGSSVFYLARIVDRE